MKNSAVRWPTQLIEGFGDMAILCLLLLVERNEKYKGRGFPLFLISYGVLRFTVEFIRETPKNLLGFSQGQWLSFGGVVIGIVLLMIIGNEKWKSKTKSNQ